MSSQSIRAIYEDGMLKPLEPLNLTEHQTVHLIVEATLPTSDPTDVLQGWQAVYEGLDEATITEIESIALDRSRFMTRDEP